MEFHQYGFDRFGLIAGLVLYAVHFGALLHCIFYESSRENGKLVWFLIILVLPVIGALWYFARRCRMVLFGIGK